MTAVEAARQALDRWDGCDALTVDAEGWEHVRALLAVITDRSVGYSVALHNDRAHALRRRDEAINEAARLANALARVEKLADQWEATAVYGPPFAAALRAALNGGDDA